MSPLFGPTINRLLVGFNMLLLSYFVVLNFSYLVLTLLSGLQVFRLRALAGYRPLSEIFASPLTPPITVLVPAYNEEPDIVDSVHSLLRLRYPEYEVIVIDDGSTDNTLSRLLHAFDLQPYDILVDERIATRPVIAYYRSGQYPNLLVIFKENGGKADALNAGINAARHPIISTIDADGLLDKDALLRTVRPMLEKPELAVASGGIVLPANDAEISHSTVQCAHVPHRLLAKYQVVEYLRAFLAGRSGWSRGNAMLIISGAFGIFRTDVVRDIGGYRTDTVGEDMELVVRMHHDLRARGTPYSITFLPDPVAWSEVPEELGAFSRQRRRWQRGLIETMWTHRTMILNPRYGLIGMAAMPFFAIFELFGPLVELLGYVLIPLAFIFGIVNTPFFLLFLLVAVLIGGLLSVTALFLEQTAFTRYTSTKEVAILAAYALLENFGYRQLTVLFRSLAFVDKLRSKEAWGRMERVGFTPSAAGGRR